MTVKQVFDVGDDHRTAGIKIGGGVLLPDRL